MLAEVLDLHFVQEVVASSSMIRKHHSDVDVAIELGGEDAKITYFGHALEQRMNGVCAGGDWSVYRPDGKFVKHRCSGS